MMSDYTEDKKEHITDEQPTGERWDPLGANDYDTEPENRESECLYSTEQLRALEEEQEILNASLFSLTTHFAQVQFRLRQIVDAPATEKEHLLKSLEEFAFRGVSDTSGFDGKLSQSQVENFKLEKLTQRHKQLELVEQLKTQLKEIETYTKTSDETNSTQGFLLERHRKIIDELKSKINSDDDFRFDGDGSASGVITPLRMKEHLVNQLKTQIADLERFIEFLQGDSQHSKQCTCSCPIHGSNKSSIDCERIHLSQTDNDEIRTRTIGIMKRAATILQMFVVMQFGCGTESFRKNDLKNTNKINHYGDLRARLELAVARLVELMKMSEKYTDSEQAGEYSSDTEESPVVACNVTITSAVRKHLAITIRDLIQHGLIEYGEKTSLVPFMMCFPIKNEHIPKKMHAWELILHYYHLKNGERYNSTPARKLSQSFNLDIVGGTTISQKQNMLSTIGSIIATHSQYKRSYDSHFKAFICAALNCNKLVTWLSLIFQCKHLINMHYHSWSYVVRTGFQDSLQTLEKLTNYKFDLPVDLAVRHFQNIKDVFM